MEVKLSSKYQLVIPKEIREKLNLKKGQKFEVFESKDIIVLVPNRPMSELCGILKGVTVEGLREESERI